MNNSKITPSVRVKCRALLIILFSLIILSCGQDAIFYNLSMEPEPKDPIVPGSPTNMVVVDKKLFVGTRMGKKIFIFDGSRWSSMSTPEGALGGLAAGKDEVDLKSYLYALVYPGNDPLKSSVIHRYNFETKSWDKKLSSSAYSIQALYSAGDRIFAGAQDRSNTFRFAILHTDLDLSPFAVRENTSYLTGVAMAGGTVYLATSNGIKIFAAGNIADLAESDPSTGKNFTGILTIGIGPSENIIAISSNGEIYTLNLGTIPFSLHLSTGLRFTGAMSVWKEYKAGVWNPSLVLLGVRATGTSRSHGYRELLLNPLTGKPEKDVRSPGEDTPTSVKNKPKYTSSIGVHPVISILQVPDKIEDGPVDYAKAIKNNPDWEPPIFASTARNGVWSYRNGQWNAE